MQHRTVRVDTPDLAHEGGTLELTLTEAGAGGAPLMLMHGFGANRTDFEDWIDELAAAGWHVVAHDHRGHGESAQPTDESAYSLEQFAADALAVADSLGWERFVLLGHSMGGMVAQEVAVTAGHRLVGLVLVDTSHGPVPVEDDLVALAVSLAREGGIDAVADAVAALGDDGPLTTEADRRLRAERPGYAARGDRNLRSSSAAMYATMAPTIAGRPDRLDALTAVAVPTLVIVGEHDALFVEPSRRIAATIPGARLAVLPDGGHSPQFEVPDAWRVALLGFLAELDT